MGRTDFRTRRWDEGDERWGRSGLQDISAGNGEVLGEHMARRRTRGGSRPVRRRVDDTVAIDEEYLKEMSGTEEGDDDEGNEGEAGPEEGAHTFGESGKAWMTVEIAEDNLQATVTALSFGGEKVEAAGRRRRSQRALPGPPWLKEGRPQGSHQESTRRVGGGGRSWWLRASLRKREKTATSWSNFCPTPSRRQASHTRL